MQQLGQADKWVGRQPPRGPGWRQTPERLGADVASPCHPLTDGPLADPQSRGDLALRPAVLHEVPGLDPSGFFPVVRGRIHAWQSTTDSPILSLPMSGSVCPDGEVDGHSAALWLAPQVKTAVIVLANKGGDTAPRLNGKIRTVVVGHVP